MTSNKEEWLERICSLFEDEIRLYSEILELEKNKTEAVTKADGKSLEVISKKTYELIVHASELERVRMVAIQDVYTSSNLGIPKEGELTLTDFLNKIDRESEHRLKQLGTRLKDTVHRLKDRIKANDKLIRTRQEFLTATIDAMRNNANSGEVAVYEDENSTSTRGKRKRSSVLVNASA
ncbi:flagellar protein FlgN [Leptospira langatensis]|uniref:Flagellar protein FlgN n=1 Tax=Leptospira langatensis TaxID=2484983 RepID=A0A5F1ZTQ6_9LEPT|nr:flagellar protein FlgN [Leptospira langatensis]TGK03068.1 flagellar protein FlgN [Leptospira langatensis]TGL41824.1 flagellar protein FlgN [Leptospira langatensis]